MTYQELLAWVRAALKIADLTAKQRRLLAVVQVTLEKNIRPERALAKTKYIRDNLKRLIELSPAIFVEMQLSSHVRPVRVSPGIAHDLLDNEKRSGKFFLDSYHEALNGRVFPPSVDQVRVLAQRVVAEEEVDRKLVRKLFSDDPELTHFSQKKPQPVKQQESKKSKGKEEEDEARASVVQDVQEAGHLEGNLDRKIIEEELLAMRECTDEQAYAEALAALKAVIENVEKAVHDIRIDLTCSLDDSLDSLARNARAVAALNHQSDACHAVLNQARNVVKEVEKEKAKFGSGASVTPLTDILSSTTKLLSDAPSRATVAEYSALARRTQKQRSWGKQIGGAMLILGGVLLIAASVAAAVLTVGLAAPISALGMVGGMVRVSAGLTIATAGGVSMFRNRQPAKQPQLRKSMLDLAGRAESLRNS